MIGGGNLYKEDMSLSLNSIILSDKGKRVQCIYPTLSLATLYLYSLSTNIILCMHAHTQRTTTN